MFTIKAFSFLFAMFGFAVSTFASDLIDLEGTTKAICQHPTERTDINHIESNVDHANQSKIVTYEDLLSIIDDSGGEINVQMAATEYASVVAESMFNPLGYGNGWTNVMLGSLGEDIGLRFVCTEASFDDDTSHWFAGFGYSWVQKATLNIGGLKITLETTEHKKESERAMHAFGFAYFTEMTGILDDLSFTLRMQYVGKERDRFVWYKRALSGHGYGYVKDAVLSISR